MWSIVEFDDGIMAVPSLWLSNSKKFCLYPPKNTKKDEISKAVRQLLKPTDDWTSYEVKRIFSTAATYKDAMRKESLALALTDCEDDNKSNEESQTQVSTQLNKGSNKPNVISSSSDDEDEDETAEKRLKNKNKLPLTNNTEEEQVSVTNKGSSLPLFKPILKLKSDRVSRELTDLDSNQNIAKPKVKSNEGYNIMDKLNYIIEMQEENAKKTHRILLELKDIPKLILEELKEISLSNKNKENANDKDLSSYFPLKTEEELSAFDGLIENTNIKKEVIDLLARRGGKDVAALTNNILARVMADELAKNYSFKGKQKKPAFTSFVLSQCIIAAVLKMFPEATETSVELKIGSWLANAPFRQKKNNKKTEETDDFGKKNDNEDD